MSERVRSRSEYCELVGWYSLRAYIHTQSVVGLVRLTHSLACFGRWYHDDDHDDDHQRFVLCV